MRIKRILLFFLMIILGLGLGLLYGWVFNPVKYKDTTPPMLRSDYKADYVLMVAEIFQADQNLEQASRRLASLGSLPPAQIVASAINTAQKLGYASHDLDLLGKLALALQTNTATPTAGGKP